jgi:hypothetical protein
VTQADVVDAVNGAGARVAQNAEAAAALLVGREQPIRSAWDLIDTAAEEAARNQQLVDSLRSLQFLDAGLGAFADQLTGRDVSPGEDPGDRLIRRSRSLSTAGS